MAQHDYNLSNNTGALYRADNNAALQAIVTQNSGTGAPAVTFPGMLWLDLSGGGNGVMRRRNQANDAWLTDIGQDQVARDAAAAAQATANSAVQRGGSDAQRTMTAPLILPAAEPANNQAVSRAQGDLLYQVRLPATSAGSLLYGTAAGWAAVLAPAANETILALSGGLPTWTSTATAAAPNQVVRTKADGTIDASFIPSVASGLRFRGTFRPAVNAEYPTTGGSGAGGVPAVGDFWVIDGLTTGGYTFLTGTLAGVTVYNGDSIAKSDGANWYRMGSSVDIEGVIKADGSVAMAANFNMGTHNIVEIGGLIARAGTPAPFQGFQLDATNVIVSPQRGTTGPALPVMATGQIGTDLGNAQIFVGAGGVNLPFVAVPFHSTTAAYLQKQYVFEWNTGKVWTARAAVTAGAFTPSQWYQVIDASGATFVGKVIIDGNISAGHLSLRNNAGANIFDFGMGVTTATDPDAFIVNRTAAGRIVIIAGGANSVTVSAAGISALQVTSTNGNYIGAGSSVVVAPSVNGTIFLRPNGAASSSAEWTISAATGHLSGAFQVNAAAFVGVSQNTVLANVAGATAGAVYIRPRGPGVATAQTWFDFGGSIQVYADVYTGSGNMYSQSTFMVLGNIIQAGIVYIRPNPGTTNQSYFNPQGDLAIPGTLYSANIPGSDARLKEHIADAPTRDLSALPFKSFNFIGKTEPQRGPIAQDVLAAAPEYVIEYSTIDPTYDLDAIPEGKSPPMVTRYTLNYGGLAIEMALNALQRIAAIEAAMATEPPTATEH
jgi:hypothetical protein